MKTSPRSSARVMTATLLLGCVPASSAFAAETAPLTATPTHVVPLTELHERSVAATEKHQKDIEDLDHFFSSEPVAKALHTGRLDGEHVRRAAALLDNDELARLAERARQAQSDFAAGSLTNQQLTYIVIALATAVIILVIAH